MKIAIEKAEYQQEFRIKLIFSDKSEQVVDFAEVLQTAKNPMTRNYLDLDKFKEFTVEYGDLMWNDYEMCFPTWDLYRNAI